MKHSRLEKINHHLFRQLDIDEQAHAVGGSPPTIVPTITITHVNGKVDVNQDTGFDH
jgi:hypothetical protein